MQNLTLESSVFNFVTLKMSAKPNNNPKHLTLRINKMQTFVKATGPSIGKCHWLPTVV